MLRRHIGADGLISKSFRAIDALLTIAPPPFCSICWISYFMQRKTLQIHRQNFVEGQSSMSPSKVVSEKNPAPPKRTARP